MSSKRDAVEWKGGASGPSLAWEMVRCSVYAPGPGVLWAMMADRSRGPSTCDTDTTHVRASRQHTKTTFACAKHRGDVGMEDLPSK